MRTAVAGGTGAVGRHVVAAVRAAGHEPVVLSRSAGVDLVEGHGLVAALEGVEAVIDVSSTSSLSAAGSIAFFGTATRNLLDAERAAGVAHHVALSIVGAAAVDAGYYAGKALQEREVVASSVGWSILRSTQFFEFARQTVERGPIAGVVAAPRFRSQPIAAVEVAAALVDLAAGPPRGLVPDLGGPREEWMPDLVRRYLRATGRRNPVIAVPLPGAMGRAMRDGALLLPPGSATGRQTFAQWLDSTIAGRDRPDRPD